MKTLLMTLVLLPLMASAAVETTTEEVGDRVWLKGEA